MRLLQRSSSSARFSGSRKMNAVRRSSTVLWRGSKVDSRKRLTCGGGRRALCAAGVGETAGYPMVVCARDVGSAYTGYAENAESLH